MPPKPLEKPQARKRVMRALVEGDKTQAEIAKMMGVKPSSVTSFKHRHAMELAGYKAQVDEAMVETVLASKQKRLERLHEYLEEFEAIAHRRGGFIATEKRWIKDEGVIEVEKTDGVLITAVLKTLDDIAAEEGARSKGPQQAVNVNVLVRTYDTPDIPT